MSQPDPVQVWRLHVGTDIPEEELRTLTAQQVENIVAAIEDAQRGLLTAAETRERLKQNGLFDLPSKREEIDRHVNEDLDQKVRALADLHGFKRAKEEGAYPPTRSN
jgi:hypothetical protein